MIVVKAISGVPVRLTQERSQHIAARHPERDSQREKVLETLSEPDLVQRGDVDTLLALRRYAETPLGDKFLAVVYKEVSHTDGFILTAYFTGRPSGRRVTVWSR